jgi:DNA-binding MarR family transcriptional regulator
MWQGAQVMKIKKTPSIEDSARLDLANRIFFRLYQCANLLHKTGSRAVEDEGLTTQQWAVLGALSRPSVPEGMTVGELARYLMVSRQNLSGVLARLERDGRLRSLPDGTDRRSRRVTLTRAGQRLWQIDAQAKIQAYYAQALDGFSMNDMTHTLHYLLRMLDNFKTLEAGRPDDGQE